MTLAIRGVSRNASRSAAVYVSVDRQGTGPIRGDGVQHRSTRSNDVQALVFVVALFGLLLALTVMLGAPIG
jgi:hypothetical protein